jgi:hypothetical protein
MNFEIGQRVKIVFVNHIRRGILHGEIIELTPYEITLKQFTEDEMTVTIKRKNIQEITEL